MKNRTLFLLCISSLSVTFLNGCGGDDSKQVPIIESLEPATGEEGDPVVITGQFLSGTTAVLFGTTTAIVIDAKVNQVTTQVPAGVAEGGIDVTVKNTGGTSNKMSFTVLPPSPVIPTEQQATITNLLPSTSYKGFPIMIRGKNLLGTVKVLFDAKEATIISKYKETVTVLVPELSNGSYTVKIVTAENGNTDGSEVSVIAAPSGFQAPPSVDFISPPPANFVNAVSNDWGIFLLSNGFEDCELVDLNDENFCGSHTFEKDATTHKVISNYMEFTRNGTDYYYGQWSSQFEIPCTQKLVFISGKDGSYLTATVDVSFTENCQ